MGMFSSFCFSVLFLFHSDELYLLSPLVMAFDSSAPLPVCPSAAVPSFIHQSLFAALPSRPPHCSCLPVFPGFCFGAWCLSFGRSSCLALPCGAPASCGVVRAFSSQASGLRPGSGPGYFLLCRSPSASGSFPGLASPSPAVAFTPLRVWLQNLSHPGQPLLGPHPPSQTSAAFPAGFQQLFPGTCPALL